MRTLLKGQGAGAELLTPPCNGCREAGPGPEVVAPEGLAGDPVVDSRGQSVGELCGIMIDVRRGRVAYGVLSSGGFLGIGDQRLAIPWAALAHDAERRCFVLGVDRRRLEGAPGLDGDAGTLPADPQWASRVHAHFGVPPYWQDTEAHG